MRSFGDNVKRSFDCFNGGLVLPFLDVKSKPRGFLEINKIRNGERENVLAVFTPESENLVVNLARAIMSRQMPGAAKWDDSGTPTDPAITLTNTSHPSYPQAVITDVSEIFITKMKFGTGGHEPLNPSVAIPPTPEDENLASPLTDPAFKPVDVDYPDNNTVRYTAVLEQSEANGETISEIGLFTDSHDLLFCRKTFGILTKSSDFAFEMRYSILF